MLVKQIRRCRICKKNKLKTFLRLGPSPLANRFVSKDRLKSKEYFFPLNVCCCSFCSLVQLRHVVDPEILYRDYIYIPSTANTMLLHFGQLAAYAILQFNLSRTSFVIDIGSNDGTLLKHFQMHGIRTLGVDPAENLADLARKKDIETICKFFNKKTAQYVVAKKGKANLITATNVFAHMDNVHEFLKGIEILLDDKGVFIIEFPYLLDLIQKNEFDTIYHEHLSYYSVKSIVYLFRQFDLEIFDIISTNVHGGSLQVFVRKGQPKSSNRSDVVTKYLINEKKEKLYEFSTYGQFAEEVEIIKKDLTKLLITLKRNGKKIAALGAPAKGNTLLNYCNIGSDVIDFIADSTPTKWGKLTPGMHIPIFPEDKINESHVDFLLILAWNFADEIVKKQHEFKKRGGKFILPIPNVHILR